MEPITIAELKRRINNKERVLFMIRDEQSMTMFSDMIDTVPIDNHDGWARGGLVGRKGKLRLLSDGDGEVCFEFNRNCLWHGLSEEVIKFCVHPSGKDEEVE